MILSVHLEDEKDVALGRAFCASASGSQGSTLELLSQEQSLRAIARDVTL